MKTRTRTDFQASDAPESYSDDWMNTPEEAEIILDDTPQDNSGEHEADLQEAPQETSPAESVPQQAPPAREPQPEPELHVRYGNIDISDKNESVAEIISSRRKKSGVDYRMINESLRIPLFFLEYLEQGRYEDILRQGVNVYTIKQNMRSICTYLEFDSADEEHVQTQLQLELEKAGLAGNGFASPDTSMPFGDDDDDPMKPGTVIPKLPKIIIISIAVLLFFILFLSKIAPYVNSRNQQNNSMDFGPLIKPEPAKPLLIPIPNSN